MNLPLFDFSEPEPAPKRQVLSVSELNRQLRETLQSRFPSIWISGEASDIARPQSGHIYLTLKDNEGQIKAVIWRGVASRLRFDLKDGMELICEGSLDVYPPRGTYQLILRQIEPKGMGALQLALEQLRERLSREGLFSPDRKRPLPRFPRRVAVVTSPTGAAIRDFLEVQRRRWRGSQVLVLPTRVQGAEAAEEIVAAIHAAQRLLPRPDVLVVTRGGGSLEDLWCFNDERVVRAIASAQIPVVSAIGHEIDVTLSDLAADVRALTPSEAAERVSPSQADVQAELDSLSRLMSQSLRRRLQLARARLEALARRPVLDRPAQRLHDLARHLDEYDARLQRGIALRIERSERRLETLSGQLEALSPLQVLARGYSVTQRADDGHVLRSANESAVGDLLRTRLAVGELLSRVIETTPP
jgi:exodeoxyribonuclease VII large subunit